MTTFGLAAIGDVIIHRGDPPANNPYRGHGRSIGLLVDGASVRVRDPLTHLSGDERVAALTAFRDGGDTDGLTFWHAPAGGGARRITDPNDIDWRSMR